MLTGKVRCIAMPGPRFWGGATLVTVGDQTLTITDTVNGLTGSVTITVGPAP